MRSLSIKTYLTLLSISIVAAIIVIILFIILPTTKKIEHIDLDLSSTKASIDLRSERTIAQHNNEETMGTLTKRVEALRTGAVVPGQELILIKELEAMAERNKVEQTLSFATAPDAYLFSVRVSGSYDNLMRHLDTLSRQPYYTISDRLSLRKQRDTAGGSTLLMEFPLKIYVQQR